MRRGPQLITADGALVTLEAAADVVDAIELRGSAQVAGVGQGANGLESMRSRDMNLGMADDGQTLQQATLVGEAVVRVAGGANAPAQQLASQAVDVEIAPDGQSVQGLSAQDDVQLDLPAANPGAPTRRIRSRSLDADGAPGVPGLRTARFAGDVEFREAAPAAKDKPAVERIVRAPALETKLQSGLGTIDRATFTEGVSVKDGTRTAQGPTMIYDVAQGTIALSSPAGATGFVQVSDERVNIEAGSLQWTLDGTSMVAQTNVKSVLKPGGGPAGSKGVKRPSMLTADQAINVTAANMTYNQQTGHAEYTGDAQLWQGATSIRAKTITLDEATGNLTAKDTVRSVMRIETKTTTKPETTATDTTAPATGTGAGTATAATTPVAPPRAAGPGAAPAAPAAPAQGSAAGKAKPSVLASDTIATANELVYDDAERRARYTGTARMVGERGDLRSERIELYFDESGRGVSRLEGFDNVRFSLKARPGGSPRWGNGGRLTYFADEERYVLSGPRAIVVERLDAKQCRETQGRTLTFFSSNDSAVVDSDNNSRTLTQTGTSCQEPPQ
jgi:lipopolysaccharide export system protein LptA